MGNISGPMVGTGAYGSWDIVVVPRLVGDTSPTAASKVLRGPYASLLKEGVNSIDLDPYNIIAVGESWQEPACGAPRTAVHAAAISLAYAVLRQCLDNGSCAVWQLPVSSCIAAPSLLSFWGGIALGRQLLPEHYTPLAEPTVTLSLTLVQYLDTPCAGPSTNATEGYAWAIMVYGRPRTWTGKGCRSGGPIKVGNTTVDDAGGEQLCA
jgi:hypothetical protein